MSETQQPAAPAAQKPATSPNRAELDRIRAAHGSAVLEVQEDTPHGMCFVTVAPRAITAVAKLLRDDPALDFKLLADLTCVDRPWEERRFCVVYNFYSLSRNRRLFLRVRVADGEAVPSLAELYACANWAEREVYDLFGVVFDRHPDLRRIELPDDWQGHPLRKDYPAVGMRPVILYNDVKDVL